MVEARPSGPTSLGELFAALLAAALNTRAMYPPDHPQVKSALLRLLTAFEQILAAGDRDSCALLLVGEDLVLDQVPLRPELPFRKGLEEMLRRHGIEGITFFRGLAPGELELFLAGAIGEVPPGSSPHLQVGRLKVGYGAGEGEGAAEGGAVAAPESRGLPREPLEATRTAFVSWRSERRPLLEQAERLVWEMIGTLGRTLPELLPLAPLQAHDERIFNHSTNVSVLTVALARGLGFAGQELHALGVAALLHDVGKLELPQSLLGRTGRLAEGDWQMIRTHPELGASHLAAVESSSPLSILVAYEHHLRFDGRPSYPLLRMPRSPNLASQMTAVADTYEVARSACAAIGAIGASGASGDGGSVGVTTGSVSAPSGRASAPPGAGGVEGAIAHRAALAILSDRAGTYLNPLLVERFTSLLEPED